MEEIVKSRDFFDGFFFGKHKKSISDYYKITKRWDGLLIFYDLLELVMSRFTYNLPYTMDARFLELCLICDGKAGICVGKDGELGNFKVGYGNLWQKYGWYNNVNYMDYMGVSQGMFIPDLPGNVNPDSVIIYDNDFGRAPISKIRRYADRLAEIQGSISATIANLKGTVIIRCTKEQEPAIRRAWTSANSGSPVIISFQTGEGANALEPTVMTSPLTGEILKELLETYDKIMSEFLTRFGINSNGVVNKLSGVSDGELRQNDQMRELVLFDDLKHRKEGIEKMTRLFGVKGTVEVADPLKEKRREEFDRMVEDYNRREVEDYNRREVEAV